MAGQVGNLTRRMAGNSNGDFDLSGTARAAQEIAAMAAELDQFISDIENFEKGKLPRLTETGFIDLDLRLNNTYQSFMRLPAAR